MNDKEIDIATIGLKHTRILQKIELNIFLIQLFIFRLTLRVMSRLAKLHHSMMMMMI